MCDLDGCSTQANMPELKVDPQERRLFLKGLAALPLAAVLAHPELASAAAKKLNTVSIPLADGTNVSASYGEAKTAAPSIILIHEWWGLNDQIKSVAVELMNQGYNVLAIDLYGGNAASSPKEAKALMKGVDGAIATETTNAWINWLKQQKQSNGKIATMGWCFGGSWSLKASIATPVDATIIYYGRVTQASDQLKQLKGPVLGHFGTQDKNINKEMVSGFETQMASAGKESSLTVHWYDANHAFANPTGSRYDETNASLAWERTLEFLKKQLT